MPGASSPSKYHPNIRLCRVGLLSQRNLGLASLHVLPLEYRILLEVYAD
jgi:hypothetical protein